MLRPVRRGGCLMPNHVHLVLAPESMEGLHRAVSKAHRRSTRHVSLREGWSGHLWQGRFASYAMDEAYLLNAVRYIELNPVRAGLAKRPEAYRWSSARAPLKGRNDGLVNVEPMLAWWTTGRHTSRSSRTGRTASP